SLFAVRDPEIKWALSYIAPYWRRLVLVLVLSLSSTALSLYLPYLSKGLVDEALLGRSMPALFRFAMLFALITVVSFVMNVISGLRYTRVSAEILFDMRLAVYRHLQRLSPRFYTRTPLGQIVSRINTDIGEIQRVAAEAALAWVGNVLFLLGTVGLLIWLDVRLFLVSLVALPPALWTLVRYRKRLEGSVATLRNRSADIGTFLIETIQGARLVVTSNAQEREIARFQKKNDGFIAALMAMRRLTYLAGGMPGLLLAGGTSVVLLYGGSRVIGGAMTMGTLVAFMAYQMRLLSPVQGLMGLYTSLATARVSLRRVHEILNAPIEVNESPDATSVTHVTGHVAFDNVSFSFDRGGPVLESVNLTVNAGETVAIVGPSGSGKSTIVDLLVRQLDPHEGTLRLDGHDLKTLKLEDVRRRIVPVEQEPFVFNASIRENIRYAKPEASDDDVVAAARAAGIDDFVERLPEKYDSVLGEGGSAVSSGERQRIAIARAFLADPAVLVLDEATASLDPMAEIKVVEGYDAVMRGRTTILITHRYDLARKADRVVVLQRGRVVEEGAPDELLARRGVFHEMFANMETVE
ncbi:MAG: ABC transporter ATP-binding protein, partial [Gemmatimonadales bacterium]